MPERLRWLRILIRVGTVLAALVTARSAGHTSGATSPPFNTIFSARIGAVTFTVSIILSGTLGDDYEAERLLFEDRDGATEGNQ